MPKQPHGAFNMYMNEFIDEQKKNKKFRTVDLSEREAYMFWRDMADDKRCMYEQKAEQMYKNYEQQYQDFSKKTESLREQIDEII